MARTVALAIILWLLSGTVGAWPVPRGVISGAFFEEEGRRPVPGALVALYEARTGYLVDSTYTRPDGKFSLRPPAGKVQLYMVATHGADSGRASLGTYDPSGPGVYREIFLAPRESSWTAKAQTYVLSKLDWLLGSIGGFFLGFWLKRWEERRGAAKTLARRAGELRVPILEARKALRDSKWDSQALLVEDSYRDVLASLQPRAAEIEEMAKGSIEDAAFVLRGAKGSRQFGEYRGHVRALKEKVSSQERLSSDEMKTRLGELSRLLAELETHPLTQL